MNVRSYEMIVSPRWFTPVVRAVTIPTSARELDSRLARISLDAYMVSPTNTGLGSFTSFHCRFAITCSLRSETESPTASESVKHELTRIFPNGVLAARFSSKWIGLVLRGSIGERGLWV